ncbi:MAG: aspartate/glutamate racemase family protein [Phycisphaerales bacterium]|nr:MAG: aspartate/glutamate racemase family protein [Phycisphaerales bacterium]
MKTIGLVGGLSWQSSLEYYRIINEAVRERLGGLHSARIVMHSFDLAEMAALQEEADWETAARSIISAAQRLEAAGANVLVICTNTMHKVADEVQKDIRIPLLHIADATAKEVKATGLKKVGLLGTKFTMEGDFWKARLVEHYGLEVIIPDDNERQIVNRTVYDELCIGQVQPSSKETFRRISQNLVAAGAQGVILGCTEIYLLLEQQDVQVPVFDTTRIHAESAARFALE